MGRIDTTPDKKNPLAIFSSDRGKAKKAAL